MTSTVPNAVEHATLMATHQLFERTGIGIARLTDLRDERLVGLIAHVFQHGDPRCGGGIRVPTRSM